MTALLFLVTVVSGAQVLTGEPASITEEILRLEELRLSDPQGFSQGLDQLAQRQDAMSSYQVCHYQFLKAYRTAFSGQAKQAVEDMEQVLPLCEDLRAKIRINALIANISAISGDYLKASEQIDNAIQNANQTEDSMTKSIAYSGASTVYSVMDQYDLSVEYSQLLYNNSPSDENLCRLRYYEVEQILEDPNSGIGLITINSYAQQCRSSGNLLLSQTMILNHVKNQLQNELKAEADLNRIDATLEQVREELSQTPYVNVKASFMAIESKLALLRKDHEKAKAMGEETLLLNATLGNTGQLIMALEVLEQVAREQGDYARSYELLRQRNEAELKVYDESQAKQMAFMSVKHSNLAKGFELEQLNRQNTMLALEKQLARQETSNQRLVILLILTLLGLLMLWMVKIKKRHDYFRDVSEIDHLTKVLTRKAFEEQVSVVLEESQEQHKEVHVSIMDLDHFKEVNDTHGHLVGDWVLKNVVYACKELMEENMLLARLGGEEFCIVMADASASDMTAKLEQLRVTIEQLDCDDSGAELTVSASFGVTSSGTSGYKLAMLLTHADIALFEAKNKGRNQIKVYDQQPVKS
ncbi:GGDEF domain-containing protein [Marinicella sediminis]|uniref:diguanylate cyclase n=1 Tax=Marinicella sediminis TaxID=1792834 RepID=A0ABV7JBD1_9GAMM|nr:GGDEF domain-containing protein [Marinicella sediminis]